MNLTRTTLRINSSLKREAEKRAHEQNTTLQAIFNDALSEYLDNQSRNKAKQIIFRTHDLGTPLDNLDRSHYYPKV
jgi:hypothetical protein